MYSSQKIKLENISKYLIKIIKSSAYVQIAILCLMIIAIVPITFSIQNPKRQIPTEAYTTPTPTPIVYTCNGTCLPGSESCYKYGTGTCPPNRFCCLNANSPTPTPIYTCNGSCIPYGYFCYKGGSGTCPINTFCCQIIYTPTPTPRITNTPTPIKTPTPTPKPSCTAKAWNVSWVRQTNPTWAYEHFYTCDKPEKDFYWIGACGQASVSSILCKYVHSKYCDLRTTMGTFPEYKFSSCTGLWMSENIKVLQKFGSNFSTLSIVAPNKQKIIQNLSYGPVIVGGYFAGINHTSLISGVNASCELIFNDPYFNSDNPKDYHRINSQYLEKYITISIIEAVSIRPK